MGTNAVGGDCDIKAAVSCNAPKPTVNPITDHSKTDNDMLTSLTMLCNETKNTVVLQDTNPLESFKKYVPHHNENFGTDAAPLSSTKRRIL